MSWGFLDDNLFSFAFIVADVSRRSRNDLKLVDVHTNVD